MLEKTTRVNILYDFYHKLLTDKQRQYMELYYREDLSLGEIATESNVSRQAIYDNIKRTEQTLESYEASLGLYEKYLRKEALLAKLEQSIESNDSKAVLLALLQQIKQVD